MLGADGSSSAAGDAVSTGTRVMLDVTPSTDDCTANPMLPMMPGAGGYSGAEYSVWRGWQWWAGTGETVSNGAWSWLMLPPQLMAVLQAWCYPRCPVPLAMKPVIESRPRRCRPFNRWLRCKLRVTHDAGAPC
ncbi:hypothetical protein [Yersinia pekkanenii]|uniref:hypothetical protein n=1 Tax=Yersinia pekkanenii TaxID=1288385 RepID=UPI0012DFEC6F|nr:hypothetical protein [Yersinia pekkanenii]